MKALVILGILLVVLGAVPVSVDVAWEQPLFRFIIRIGPVSLRTGKNAGKKQRGETEPDSGKSSGLFDFHSWFFKSLLSHGFEYLCRVVSSLRVGILKIHFTSASSDPASAAMMYGMAGSAMESLLNLGKDHILHSDLCADVDFDSSNPIIVFRALVYMRIYRLAYLAFGFGVCLVKDYFRYWKERRRKHG